jgi:uroporphyrinogen-III synthase
VSAFAGACVLVVRPRAQAAAWVDELRALGVDAHALPLIEILDAPEPARVAESFAEVARLSSIIDEASADARSTDDDSTRPLLVFVSPNAVAGFFAAASASTSTVPAWPAEAWAAATGPGTVAALRAAGVPAHRIVAPPADAAQFDSEALWQRIASWRWAARPVWLVRGNGGRDWLGARMRERGADVRVLQSYARAAPDLAEGERARLAAAIAEPARWIWMFSSSEAIDHLVALAPRADWRAGRAFASHPRIAERARAAGFGEVAVIVASPAAVAATLASR